MEGSFSTTVALFGDQHGLPSWRHGCMDIKRPDLPPCQMPQWHEEQRHYRHTTPSFACCFGTANVQLYRGPQGHGGKLHCLQQQMRMFNFNCLAIQEGKSDPGMSTANNILRISTGSLGANYGSEIWFDLDMPYGNTHRDQTLLFCKDHFQVVHADSRRLLLRCDTGHFSFWALAGHAPHGGHTPEDRRQWWDEFHSIPH